MSLETWKAEFYPVPVEIRREGAGIVVINVPKAEAVAHSIKKWEGLSKKNLEKHGRVHRSSSQAIREAGNDMSSAFFVSADTCALCAHYISSRSEGVSPARCETCPLSIARGGIACDAEHDDADTIPTETRSPYDSWIATGDPLPMLRALADAAHYEAEQANKAELEKGENG